MVVSRCLLHQQKVRHPPSDRRAESVLILQQPPKASLQRQDCPKQHLSLTFSCASYPRAAPHYRYFCTRLRCPTNPVYLHLFTRLIVRELQVLSNHPVYLHTELIGIILKNCYILPLHLLPRSRLREITRATPPATDIVQRLTVRVLNKTLPSSYNNSDNYHCILSQHKKIYRRNGNLCLQVVSLSSTSFPSHPSDRRPQADQRPGSQCDRNSRCQGATPQLRNRILTLLLPGITQPMRYSSPAPSTTGPRARSSTPSTAASRRKSSSQAQPTSSTTRCVVRLDTLIPSFLSCSIL